MTDIARVLMFAVSCVFTHNVVFVRLMGSCELKEARRVETSVAYGLAVAAVTTLSSICLWLLDNLVLTPLGAGFFRLTAFVAVIVVITMAVKLGAAKLWPAMAEGLDASLAAIGLNCAVLGLALINLEGGYGFGEAFASGLLGGLGFAIAVVLMAGVHERLEFSKIPEPLKGLPISMISASLIALAFMGFAGIA